MSRAKRPAARDELHVGFPLQPLDDAALAIGRSILDFVFRPMANGKIPPKHWNCRVSRDEDWEKIKQWGSRVHRYCEMRDDYLGGW